jgi:hypothetical protein
MQRTFILLLMMLFTATAVIAGPGGEKSRNGDAISKSTSTQTMPLEEQGKTQYWPYGSSERRAWETRGYNQWGGHDLWCISRM